MGRAHLSTGKLRQELVTLVRQATGTAPVVAQLGSVIGEFALGGPLVLGVTAGIAAIAFAYRAITKESREAREEQDKLIKSLERELELKALGPGGETLEKRNAAQRRANDLKIEIDRLEKALATPGRPGESPMMQQHRAEANRITEEKLNALYIERQQALNDVAGAQSIIDERLKALDDKPVKNATESFKQMGEAVKNVSGNLAMALRITRELGPMMARLNQGATQGALDTITSDLFAPFKMPNIPAPFEGLSDKEKATLRQLGVLTDHEDQNTQKLHDAIWGSAAAMANSIVSALNIGGGGKGSNLGGALGGTAGFAAGFAIGGPVGGAIGSTLGNVFGSLVGGLFDHKRAVDNNTAAIKANTAALLLNAPRGFDVNHLRSLGATSRRYASRGGVPILTVGT